MNIDGTWIYGLQVLDGGDMEVGGQIIFGYFTVDEYQINHAHAYSYDSEDHPDGERLKHLSPWNSSEVATSDRLIYIRYKSSLPKNQSDAPEIVDGFISAKLVDVKPKVGAQPCEGSYFDLNTNIQRSNGTFYGERLPDGSLDTDRLTEYAAAMYGYLKVYRDQ